MITEPRQSGKSEATIRTIVDRVEPGGKILCSARDLSRFRAALERAGKADQVTLTAHEPKTQD